MAFPSKLRNGLLISRQDTPEGVYFVIKDPSTGRYFRLKEHEHFIARQLDGATSLECIRQRSEQTLDARLSRDVLEEFVESLGRLGLLESATPPRPQQRRRKIRGSLLYLRLAAFDPDRLLDSLIGKLGFFFSPLFLLLSTFVILFGVSIALANSEEILRDLRSLYRIDALFLAWVTLFAVITAHEFAHALTCKRFGGTVNEMGFLLIFFQPAFYCNVSDAWLFPEKSKRLWVTFAGAYFEVFLWALATLGWRLAAPETTLSHMALIVMATSGIKTLFNLNPLIKLDGYYLLSDYLEVPNLRAKAFGYLRTGIGRLRGAAAPVTAHITPRERRIYLVYGLMAAIFSTYLLGLILTGFGRFLVQRYQGTGFVLFAALMMTIVQMRIRKTKPAPEGSGSPQPARRPSRFSRRHAKILGVAAVLLVVLFLGRLELKVAGEFEILPVHNNDVRAEVEGMIEEVYVDEGDVVRKGEVIARLSDREYQAQLQQTEAEINEKQAMLRLLYAGARSEEIDLAKRRVDTAETKLEQARKRFEEAGHVRSEQLLRAEASEQKAEDRLSYSNKYLSMSNALGRQGLISQREAEQAKEQEAVRERELTEARAELKVILANDLSEPKAAFAVATKELEEANGALRMLLAGSRPEEIEATEAELASLQARQHYLREKKQLLKITSSISGLITTPKLKEKAGQYLKVGDLVAEVHKLDQVEAEIAIPEKEIADVKVGEKVVIKARAYPEKSFYGSVTEIASSASKKQDNPTAPRTILATTRLDNSSLLLKPAMTGNAKIYCGKRLIFDLITRRFTRYLRVEFWSWW